MRDRLMIHGIRFHGYHGTTEEEKTLGRTFTVDVELFCDTRQGARHDRLEDTIDYAKVFDVVNELGKGPHCELLETLAEKLAGQVLERFPVHGVRIRILKFAPPLQGCVESVGIDIERMRGENGQGK